MQADRRPCGGGSRVEAPQADRPIRRTRRDAGHQLCMQFRARAQRAERNDLPPFYAPACDCRRSLLLSDCASKRLLFLDPSLSRGRPRSCPRLVGWLPSRLLFRRRRIVQSSIARWRSRAGRVTRALALHYRRDHHHRRHHTHSHAQRLASIAQRSGPARSHNARYLAPRARRRASRRPGPGKARRRRNLSIPKFA